MLEPEESGEGITNEAPVSDVPPSEASHADFLLDDLLAAPVDIARYRAIFDAAHIGLAETDSRGVIRVANPHLAHLLGVTSLFLRGKPLLHFIVRGDCSSFRVLVANARDTGGHDKAHLRLRPRDGSAPFVAEMFVQPITAVESRAFVWTVRGNGSRDLSKEDYK